MGVSFIRGRYRFSFKVSAVIISGDQVLVMKDDSVPCYHLPGGRVRLGETAEHAVLRETREQLGIDVCIERPLWLNQAFFTEDVTRLRCHELCAYFLMSPCDIKPFTRKVGFRTCRFAWLPFSSLETENFYPKFMKTAVYHLPEQFTIRSESG